MTGFPNPQFRGCPARQGFLNDNTGLPEGLKIAAIQTRGSYSEVRLFPSGDLLSFWANQPLMYKFLMTKLNIFAMRLYCHIGTSVDCQTTADQRVIKGQHLRTLMLVKSL